MKSQMETIKRFCLLTLFGAISLVANSQQYVVYEVKGEAFKVVKKVKTPLSIGMKLDKGDVVNLTNSCVVKLLDKEAREKVTLKNQCAGSIESLINEQNNSRESVTAQVVSYIVTRMTRKGSNKYMMEGRTTGIHRGDDESLLASDDEMPVRESMEVADSVHIDLSSTPFQGCSIGSCVPAEKPRTSPVKLHIAFTFKKR